MTNTTISKATITNAMITDETMTDGMVSNTTAIELYDRFEATLNEVYVGLTYYKKNNILESDTKRLQEADEKLKSLEDSLKEVKEARFACKMNELVNVHLPKFDRIAKAFANQNN